MIGCAHSDSLGGKKLSAGWTGPLLGGMGCSHWGISWLGLDEIFPQCLVPPSGRRFAGVLGLGAGVHWVSFTVGHLRDTRLMIGSLRFFLAWCLAMAGEVEQPSARPRTAISERSRTREGRTGTIRYTTVLLPARVPALIILIGRLCISILHTLVTLVSRFQAFVLRTLPPNNMVSPGLVALNCHPDFHFLSGSINSSRSQSAHPSPLRSP